MANQFNNNIMKHQTDYFTNEEINKMFTYLINNGRLRDYMLFNTLYKTERRISEILGKPPYLYNVGLRPIDLHPEKPLIEFDILKKNPIMTKTKKGATKSPEVLKRLKYLKKPMRKVKAVDSKYYSELKKYIANNHIPQETRVFNITRQRADKILKEVAEACGIHRPHSKIHCHQFRHTFSIHFLEANNMDPAALIKLQNMLEHSTLEITKGYLQYTQEDIIKSLDKTFNNDNF